MAVSVNTELQDLTELTSADGTDILYIVDDPTGTPLSKKITVENLGSSIGVVHKNIIINGEMKVSQRGTSFTSSTTPANNNDTYLMDKWVLLSDGNDVVDVTQDKGVVPVGGYASQKLEVETINKQFGILQIIEAKNSASIIGGVASLSFDARMKLSDDNTHSLKAVVLSWTSTEDVVTSDIVSAWGATPTYVANWTAENVPASNTLTIGWQTFTIENIAINAASAKNVAVFIFCDQTDGAIDDVVYISNVQLELGATATDFEHLLISEDESNCFRYARNHAFFIPDTEEQSHIIDMRDVPTITGGGAGFSSTGTTASILVYKQTTGAVATLLLDADL